MSASRPLPQPDEDTAPFWEAARDGRLLIQRCESCGAVQFYPRVLCTACGEGPPAWQEASGRGTVHTFTIVRQNLVPPFKDLAPYVLAIIDLEEGVRMMGNVLECDPADVHIGMAVEVVFEPATDELSLPMWRPASA